MGRKERFQNVHQLRGCAAAAARNGKVSLAIGTGSDRVGVVNENGSWFWKGTDYVM